MLQQLLFWALLIGGYFYFQNQSNQEQSKKQYIVFVCIVLILQSGLRHVAVGSDTFQYFNRFKIVSEQSWSEIWHLFYTVYVLKEGKDPGYDVLEKAFQFFTEDFQLFLIFVAIFFFTAFGRLLYRFTDNVLEVLISVCTYTFLFYSFFSITGIRQSISVACGIYAFLAMLDKKYWLFVLLIIPAFFIHRSAAIILLFPILFWFKNRKLLNISAVILFIFAWINRSFLVQVFQDLADYDDYDTRLPYNLMAFLFVFTIFIAYSVRFFPKNHIIQNLYNLYIPTFMMIPLLGWDSLFMREVLFFSVFSCVLVPKGLKYTFTLKSPVIYIYIVICFAHFMMTQSRYAFFWEDMALGSNYQ